MPGVEKTVFISYRRASFPWALAVLQHLTHHGFDVFFDVVGIASGDFEQVILENVRSRAHFLVLLTPSTLQRCAEPGDWLRREIEGAMACRRNIVPVMLEGFDFGAPGIRSQLTGALAAVPHPLSEAARTAAKIHQSAAASEHAKRASDRGEQDAFGEELTQHAGAARAHRRANRHFALAPGGAREQKICRVGASNQQQ